MVTKKQYDSARKIIIEYKNQLQSELNNVHILCSLDESMDEITLLDARMYNCLKAYGCVTVFDVIKLPIHKANKFRNWGKKSTAQLKYIQSLYEIK